MPWLDDPVSFVASLPALTLVLPLFVLVSAMLEFIIPPYWGDLFVLVGFFLAGQPTIPVSPWIVFGAALAGSFLGAVTAYLLGRRYGLRVMRRVAFWRPTGTRARIRELLSRFGERFLILNRFVPFFRGFLTYGAGAMKLRFSTTIGYTTLGSAIWIGLLAALGLLTAGSWDEILAAFRQTNRILGLAVGLAVAGWIAFLCWRLRFGRQNA